MTLKPLLIASVGMTAAGLAVAAWPEPARLTFSKQVLTSEYLADGVAVGDINRDGRPDIVAGPYWYGGPDYRVRTAFYPPNPLSPEMPATDSMFSFLHDFDGDGWTDILVLGRIKFHEACWYRNPGTGGGEWTRHFVAHRINGESKIWLDADGDGRPELVTHQEKRWGFLAPVPGQPTAPWKFRAITTEGPWVEYHHGTGLGDLDGDGRPDLVLYDGWWRQSAEPGALWEPHPMTFGAGRGGAQMLVYDVDGDGDNDVVSSIDAHRWGLAWFENRRIPDGAIAFVEHSMMGDRSEEARFGVAFSQPHALCLGDVDGDGLPDVVVGKRRWAHGKTGDIEPMADPVVYCFRLVRAKGNARFVPERVDAASGVGVQIAAVDLDGDGRAEILTASKLGAFLFRVNGEKAPVKDGP